MDARRTNLELLARAGQLLLQFNDSTDDIHGALTSTALGLTGEKCDVAVSYSGIAVSLPGEGPCLMPVREIRYNTAVQTQVHAILEQVRRGDIEPAVALARLNSATATTPRHASWIVAISLAAGAAALAGILGADLAAAAIASLSTALGFIARQELHRRHFSLLTLPLAAGFVAGVVGGSAIRFGWTQSPGLALIVPCLMIVPGPHLINGLLDLIDNHVPMSLARLALAAGILFASSLGLLVGAEVTLSDLPPMKQSFTNEELNLLTDLLLAAVVTTSFAVYYNTVWRHVGLAAVGGAIGHGLRFLALEAGCSLAAASFIGGLAVGAVAAWICRRSNMPVAVIAFAGAVTMLPGLQIYSAIRGVLQLIKLHTEADAATVASTLAGGMQAAAVVGALGLGLIVALRTAPWRTRDRREGKN